MSEGVNAKRQQDTHPSPTWSPFVAALDPEWRGDTESVRWFDSIDSTASGRSGRWASRYAEVRLALLDDRFIEGHGAWVRNQRRAKSLTLLQQLLLEAIPGWSWAPQEDAWDARRTQFAEFLRDHDRMPRVRAKDLHERALAHWYSRQRVLEREGKLTHTRVQSFKALLRRETQASRS